MFSALVLSCLCAGIRMWEAGTPPDTSTVPAAPPEPLTAVVRVDSHRGRALLARALGFRPPPHYRGLWDGEYYRVTAAQADDLLGLDGVTRADINPADLHPYD